MEDEMPFEKKIKAILTSSLLLCFVFCFSANTHALSDSSYFPLEIGNQWILSSQPDTLIETVADTQLIEGNIYFSFDQFRNSSGYLLRMFANQVFIYVDTTEYLWYDFSADSGDTWTVPPLPHPFDGGNFSLQSKTDTVVTPAGTFTDCYRIHHFIAADAEFVEWFAPGIGIVQRDVITIAGPRRWALIDALITSVNNATELAIPKSYTLSQNYPNPFNPETTIRFQLPRAGHVVLRIFNIRGQKIRTLIDSPYQAGSHDVRWDSKDNHDNPVSSGLYFYQLQVGDFSQVRKMSLLR